MKEQFWSISAAEKNGGIRIVTSIDFDVSYLLPQVTELKEKNYFTIATGKKLFDIVDFHYSSLHFAISKRFKDILEQNNVKGWSAFPIIIEGIEEEYFAFQVLSEAGEILNLEASNNYTERTRFDITTWDGSGIFNLKDTALILCTPEVKELIERNKISNIDFSEL